MIDILPDELFIWEAYGYRCVLGPHPAVTLHEEPPKSLNPKWRDEFWNRFPLCNECHNRLHSIPREEADALLKKGNKVYDRLYLSGSNV